MYVKSKNKEATKIVYIQYVEHKRFILRHGCVWLSKRPKGEYMHFASARKYTKSSYVLPVQNARFYVKVDADLMLHFLCVVN